MGTFCPNLWVLSPTDHYGIRKSTDLSMIFRAISHGFYVLGLNSYDILGSALSYVTFSQLLKALYHTVLLLTRLVNNTVACEEVETW